MVVTDLQYHIETKLIKKLDLMINRCERIKSKQDALLNIEGKEGHGKTNTSLAIAYYVKSKTGRNINLFFDSDKMLNFAKTTEKQIIIWDEPGLDALSVDILKKKSKNLIKLLMLCRKKRHFIILNITYFHKFQEYIIVDRALGMIHMYMRDEEVGRFVYIRQKFLEALYNTYRSKKKRDYKKYGRLRGNFPELLERPGYFEHMDVTVDGKQHATLIDYNLLKDKAIESIGEDDKKPDGKDKKALIKLRWKIATIRFPITTMETLAAGLGIKSNRLREWRVAGKYEEDSKKDAKFDEKDDEIDDLP